MLKIKGLKKKKKGKKGKHKEDDLFDPEELEQYRREHQQKLEAGEVQEAAGEGTSSSEKGEEWQKFQALTAGVDDILKKTQGDLTRIKSTSYFQRKPPGPSTTGSKEGVQSKQEKGKSKHWAKFEDGATAVDEDHEEDLQQQPNPDDIKQEVEQGPPAVEEEEEDESEHDEDIFDTSYVDVVASGDVKLAFIPDSPTEEDTGPDPFDTSIVDKVIKVDPKKKHLVSLGCAVEVLTGRVDKPIPVPEALPKRRKRPKKQDLLLESFDEFEVKEDAIHINDEPPLKSILDEESEFVSDEIDLTINLATILPPPSPLVEHKLQNVKNIDQISKSIVEEFDIVDKLTQDSGYTQVIVEDNLDDEFAALAQESILKETIKGDHLDGRARDSSELKSDYNDDAVDPFDTTFAANVLPGKFELKLIEEEILLKDHDFPIKTNAAKFLEEIPSVRLNDSTNEHNFLDEDQTPLSFKHRDLLGGSTTDLSKIGDSPIEPVAPKEGSADLLYSDPFDTSVVDVLVAPGKTELKFLEQELLDGVIRNIEEEDDFNPREDSPIKQTKPLTRPDQLPVGEKRLSIPKVVAFNINKIQTETDLLIVNQDENSKAGKPLTPYYANPDELNSRPSYENESFVDPFDTSFVSHAPGKAELKLIESELVIQPSLKHSLSDPDFNPRDGIEENINNCPENPISILPPLSLPIETTQKSSEKIQPDILTADTDITVKLHTPVVPKKIADDLENLTYIDPFDTSTVRDLVPGKAELKLLESELISSDTITSIKRSYTDPDFNPRDSPEKEQQSIEIPTSVIDDTAEILIAEKPLTPQSATSKISFDIGADIDPFDTSCVENLVPGKTELKLIESELIN